MKLSWFNTSMGTQSNQACIWYNNMINAQSKERESQWNKRKQQDLFRGSSTQLYVPTFTQKDSTNLSTQDSHTGNLHWGFGGNTITGSTQLLSLQPQPPSWGKAPSQQTITSQLEGLAQSLHKDHLTTWGMQPKCTNLLNTMRERHKAKQIRVYNLVV